MIALEVFKNPSKPSITFRPTEPSLLAFFPQMSGRIYVVIFFGWAALTIITPTLIILSETSKPYSESQDEGSHEGFKARRLIGYAVKHRMITTTAQNSAPSPSPAPAPAPIPEKGSGTNGIDLARVFSESLRLVIRKTKLRLK